MSRTSRVVEYPPSYSFLFHPWPHVLTILVGRWGHGRLHLRWVSLGDTRWAVSSFVCPLTHVLDPPHEEPGPSSFETHPGHRHRSLLRVLGTSESPLIMSRGNRDDRCLRNSQLSSYPGDGRWSFPFHSHTVGKDRSQYRGLENSS